jgi:hypothetical protein
MDDRQMAQFHGKLVRAFVSIRGPDVLAVQDWQLDQVQRMDNWIHNYAEGQQRNQANESLRYQNLPLTFVQMIRSTYDIRVRHVFR